MVKLGQAGSNDGKHEIELLTQVGENVVSGKVDPENIEALFGALNRVKHVKYWEDIPPFISYDENEQPYLNDGRDFKRVDKKTIKLLEVKCKSMRLSLRHS